MAAHNPHLVARYVAQFSVDDIIAQFACLGFALEPTPDFRWDGRRRPVLAVGEPAPVIRALPRADAFEIRMLPWGIPYRRQSQSAPLFNFHAGTDDFALSARLLAPVSTVDNLDAGGRPPAGLWMAAGIERSGAWTMLTRSTPAGDMEAVLLPKPSDWKAWLLRGDLSAL